MTTLGVVWSVASMPVLRLARQAPSRRHHPTRRSEEGSHPFMRLSSVFDTAGGVGNEPGPGLIHQPKLYAISNSACWRGWWLTNAADSLARHRARGAAGHEGRGRTAQRHLPDGPSAPRDEEAHGDEREHRAQAPTAATGARPSRSRQPSRTRTVPPCGAPAGPRRGHERVGDDLPPSSELPAGSSGPGIDLSPRPHVGCELVVHTTRPGWVPGHRADALVLSARSVGGLRLVLGARSSQTGLLLASDPPRRASCWRDAPSCLT